MECWQLDNGQGPPTLLIEWEGRGPLLVLQRDRMPSECWQIPPTAELLVTTSSVIEEISGALEKVELSAAARTTMEKLLTELLTELPR